MITSENGHFEFGSLKPGKFSLQGAKRGFIHAAYEQHEQFSTAIVTGAGFDTGNLVLRLTPLALLGGKVIDESGDPVRNARVMLYVEDHQAGMNRITRAGNGLSDDQVPTSLQLWLPGITTCRWQQDPGMPCILFLLSAKARAMFPPPLPDLWTLPIRPRTTTAQLMPTVPRLSPFRVAITCRLISTSILSRRFI